MKTTLAISILAALALVLAAGALGSSASSHSTLVIRHQLHGCHAWAVDGGAYAPSQTVTMKRGSWLSVTNNDVMPHKLVETSGPAVTITRLNTGMAGMGLKGTFPAAMLAHMGAAAKLTFAKAGVYHFTTKPGEDYMTGMKTVGDDYVLKLTVVVR